MSPRERHLLRLAAKGGDGVAVAAVGVQEMAHARLRRHVFKEEALGRGGVPARRS